MKMLFFYSTYELTEYGEFYFMNYYEQIFKDLSLNSDKDKALNQIVKIFLYRNTKFSMPENLNKTDIFFQSDFIHLLQKAHLQNDNWQLALSQYFRFGKIAESQIISFLDLDEESTILSIRLSGIINNLNHLSWTSIKNQQNNYPKLNSFIKVVEYLNQQYQSISDAYLSINKKWQWTHLDVLVFASLYLYEIVLTQQSDSIVIPYQIDTETPIQQEKIFNALHSMVVTAHKSRKLLTDKNLRPSLNSRIEPFIYGKNLTTLKIQEYEDFKQSIALKVELGLFSDFVFNAFSYNKSINYTLKNEKLNHTVSSSDNDFYSEKFTVLQMYWKWRGIKCIDESILNKEKFNYWLKENEPIHVAEALADTHAAILLLKEIYGVEKIVLNNEQEYDIFNTLFTINMQQKYYQKSFIDPFLEFYQINPAHPFKTLGILTLTNYITGQNFYPIITGTKENKAKNMGKAWLTEGSNREKVKKMTAILDFWSCNLNANDQDSYIEKPFYELDGRIIQIPQRIGKQNIYGSIVNYLRKLHKNRESLKNETNSIENYLAKLFIDHKLRAFCQYIPQDKLIGEIDLIVVEDNTILIIELKSTFLKTNLKEAYQYQNFTLKKAAFQLDRKLKYIQENYTEFTDKEFQNIKFHSWIVDTTLEADHKYFNKHLKISLEELIINLKNHCDFIDFYKNLPEHYNNETDYKEKFSLQKLVEQIEKNIFWKNSLEKYEGIKNKIEEYID